MKSVSSPNAPAAIGPYSQAIDAGGMIFVSGQIALSPKTGELVAGSVEEETAQVLENLGAVLEAAGCTFASVARTTIYLTSMADFQAVNALYARAFGDHRPARATIAVAALPRGARVEIDAIAFRG